MIAIAFLFVRMVCDCFKSRRRLDAELLVLRHQLQLYPTVYLHKATRGAEKIFGSLLFRVVSLVRRGLSKATGLPNNHPLIRFAKQPDEVDNILALDDSVIWGALPLMSTAKDPLIAEFSTRLHERRLYKCLDVHSELAQAIRDHKKGPAKGKTTKAQSMKFDQACVAINEKITEWASQNKGELPKVLIDVDVREPYKRFQESKGPLNQIRIRTQDGELVDLGERSKIVAAIEPFRLFRLYVERNDSSTQQFVRSVIQKEAKNAAKH
jgi:uncharacterized protein